MKQRPRPRPYLTAPVPPSLAARRQEKALARAHDGRRQPGSGSKPGFRGDIRTADTVEEWKYTAKRSYILSRAALEVIEQHALDVGAVPLFGVEFREAASIESKCRWIMMPYWLYDELRGALDIRSGLTETDHW